MARTRGGKKAPAAAAAGAAVPVQTAAAPAKVAEAAKAAPAPTKVAEAPKAAPAPSKVPETPKEVAPTTAQEPVTPQLAAPEPTEVKATDVPVPESRREAMSKAEAAPTEVKEAEASKAEAPAVEAELTAKSAVEEEEEVPVLIKCDFAPPEDELSAQENVKPELAPGSPEKEELAREPSSEADTAIPPAGLSHITSNATCATEPAQGDHERSSADLTAPATCRINAVCASTQPGQVLALVGSDPALGAWDAAKALHLSTSAETFPTWSVDVPTLDAGVEFKLIMKSADGLVTWEPVESNRVWASVGGVIGATWGQS